MKISLNFCNVASVFSFIYICRMTRVDKLKISLNFCNVTSVFSFIYIYRMTRVEKLMSPVYFLSFIFIE